MKSNISQPKHVGIILDGNRRWAKEHNLPSLEGHRQGFNKLKGLVGDIFDQTEVEILTVYAFSTENWRRDKSEVDYLLDLFKTFIRKEVRALVKSGIKVNFWGRLNDFNQTIQDDIAKVGKLTNGGFKGILNVCLNYGGRDDIVRAFKKIVAKGVKADDISEDLIGRNLDSAGYPDPDLIIRTSGEQRLSGFLTWQSVYSELYCAKVYWPDFSLDDFKQALSEYGRRQRRFGSN